MTRFADTHIAVTDRIRTRKLAKAEAEKIDRQFAPIRARVEANRRSFTANRSWGLALA